MSRTLAPQNSTFYGSLMNPSRSFQLNISSWNSTGEPVPVKVTVSISQAQGTEKDALPGYPQIGSLFYQNVSAAVTGTYIVDIENENSFNVTLLGKILVNQAYENYRTVYPYVIPGFLIMIAGTSILVYGIFKKHSKAKLTRVKKIRR